VDKIPIKEMTYSPGDESYHLGTLTISKSEYAYLEKSNEVIEWCRKLEETNFQQNEIIQALKERVSFLEAKQC